MALGVVGTRKPMPWTHHTRPFQPPRTSLGPLRLRLRPSDTATASHQSITAPPDLTSAACFDCPPTAGLFSFPPASPALSCPAMPLDGRTGTHGMEYGRTPPAAANKRIRTNKRKRTRGLDACWFGRGAATSGSGSCFGLDGQQLPRHPFVLASLAWTRGAAWISRQQQASYSYALC